MASVVKNPVNFPDNTPAFDINFVPLGPVEVNAVVVVHKTSPVLSSNDKSIEPATVVSPF